MGTVDARLATTIDQYTRQKWASLMMQQISKSKLEILDVGGYKGLTGTFSPGDDVTVCDLFDVDEPNYVKGDGRSLPFKDSSFDFVLSFDTYEHVPRDGRENFIKELLRVSRAGVILAAPFDNKYGSVHLAEKKLNEYHKNLYDGKDHPWLKEHIDFVIPKRAEIESYFKKLNVASYYGFASNSLKDWALFQTIYFSIDLDEDLRGRADEMSRYYNAKMEVLDLAEDEEAYRRIYFFSDNENHVQKIKNFIEAKKQKQSQFDRAEFTTRALSTLGLKYRDIQMHDKYMTSELNRIQASLEDRLRAVDILQSEVNRLLSENESLKRKFSSRVIGKLTRRLH
jgi:ubiquinone/menaquinone biosynthesis C-methylase UbiE